MFAELDDLAFSNPLSDCIARNLNSGGRRTFECPRFTGDADIRLCLAAWHTVLHLLCYNDEPVLTCLIAEDQERCWPIVSSVTEASTLEEVSNAISAQWPTAGREWINVRNHELPWLDDQLYCHAIRLSVAGIDEGLRAGFELVKLDSGWRIDCDAGLYGEAYLRRVASLWKKVGEELWRYPAALIGEQILIDEGVERTIRQLSLLGPVVPITGNLLTRFQKQVALVADKTAVVDVNSSITYRQLDELSNQWASLLQSRGVTHGDCVGVSFNRNIRMVVAQIAVLKLGAVFVAMDCEQPATRLGAIIEDTDLSIILTEQACAPMLRERLAEEVTLLVAEEFVFDPRESWTPRLGSIHRDDLAYIIFTSGSTGRPKGVMVSHGNLLNFAIYIERHLGSSGISSQFAPFTFDASVAEIHSSILNGATLVILSKALIDDPERLQAYMTEQNVTFAAFPPQYAKHLSPEKLPKLKTLLTAGSAPDRELIKRWHPHLQYINAYGPTETTILSTAWHADRIPDDDEPIAMGAPIYNTGVRIINRFGQTLPEGLVGELLIGGAGVAQGYLKREELTSARFIDADEGRWYRSGDLSCLYNSNELIFAGRVDDQVKLRGHRLEPGEVEAALLTIRGVEAVAAVVNRIQSETQLVVFCSGMPIDEETMREEMANVLPQWAMPNRVIWLAVLPMTVNGKVDYRELKSQLLRDKEHADVKRSAFVDCLEERIAEIWQNTLQQPAVSRDDNFIHLGGDSLTALVVMSALRRLGYAISSSQLLSHPVLADFAQLLRVTGNNNQQDYSSWQGDAAISPIQGWFFDLDLKNPGAFCQTLIFDAAADLDIEKLQSALSRLVGYHDQLRATFVEVRAADGGSRWIQRIADESMPVPRIACSEVGDSEIDQHGENFRQRLAAELSIAEAPLFRIAVLRSAARARVIWVLHHLLVDTISHSILLDDLYHLYLSGGQARDVLPGKTMAYASWANALSAKVDNDPHACLAAWRATLEDSADVDQWPLPSEDAPEDMLAAPSCHFSKQLTANLLERAPACYRQSAEELVLAASYIAIARTLNLKKLGIDIEWHGRDEGISEGKGLARSVGWFTSVHPLCMTVDSTLDLSQWLVALKEKRAAIPERGRYFYALRYLSEDAEVRGSFAGYRKPRVLFNFSGVIQRRQSDWNTVPVIAIEMGEGNGHPYDLSVESEIRSGELIVSLFLNDRQWAPALISQLQSMFSATLEAIVAHCCNTANSKWTPSDFPQLALTQEEVNELPAHTVAAYPLTDMQQTMLRHEQTYQVWMHYSFPRNFREQAFRKAVGDWAQRHDCLRTFIKPWGAEKNAQVVLESYSPSIAIHQVNGDEIENTAQALIHTARQSAVSVCALPPFSLQVIDGGGQSFSFLLSIHHIIHDGWSIELLISDLFQRYRMALDERGEPLQVSLSTMADVVTEQQRLSASEAWNAYWSELPWESTACQLPVRKNRTAPADLAQPTVGQPTGKTALYLGHIDDKLVANVRAKAKALGVTVNSLWLSAYALLLRYLGNSRQVRCGVIQNGRMETIPGVETLTGCCVNTLPLVLNVAGDATLSDVVKQVSDRLSAMRNSAAFPLSRIHGMVKSRVEGDMFETLFNIESSRYGANGDNERPSLMGGYESTNYRFIFGLIEKDIASACHDGSHSYGYDLRIGYDTGLYDVACIQQWAAIYENILALMVSHITEPWNSLQPLPAVMIDRIREWNNTMRDYPKDACIAALFHEQVAAKPDHAALAYKDIRITYAELDRRTDELALLLQAKGVGPEVIVGLVAERSIEMVIGILAVFKAGGAYVPIDPKYPSHRVRHMVVDVGCEVIIYQHERLAGVVPGDLGVDAIFLDRMSWSKCASAEKPNTVGHHSRQLAYVMYTSGSTGNPKGVMIEQRSIVRLVKNNSDIDFAADDCILLTSAPGFDVTTFEVWGALLNGLTLAIVDEETLLDPQTLAAEIASKKVATLWLVAPLFNQLVQEKPDMFAGVKQLMIGGDALSPAHIRMVRKANPAVQVINGYGPTENTSFSTYHLISNRDDEIIPIGHPITNSSTYVVNRDGQLLPPGVNGELYVGGDGVGRGYWNRPELTAEKFVDNNFSKDKSYKLYKTGDLVCWRDDGVIDFLGRIDHQVKIRGFRVELGEIENAISAHDNVKQVLVVVKKDGNQQQLIAYLIAKELNSSDEQQKALLTQSIIMQLEASLPEYMVPAAFVIMASMPLNANGKIDRARLPQPGTSAYAHNPYAEPENERERILLTVWKEVLGVASFGVTDNFFSIGGDSILAIQVVSRAAKQNLVITPRQIIEEKTIRNLASKLSDSSSVAASAKPRSAASGTDAVVKGEQRLLPIQLQFLQDDAVDTNHYSQYAFITLPGNVTRETLKTALAAIVARHDSLRLKFRETPAGWVAHYRPELLSEITNRLDDFIVEEDLASTTVDGQVDGIAEAAATAQAGLDIKQGKLCKWVWFKGDGQHKLLWVSHHLIVDGVSWRILLNDLQTALAQCGRGEKPSLDAKSSSYQEWAVRLHEYAYSASLEQEKSYWLKQLTLPAARMTFDHIDNDKLEPHRHPAEQTTAYVDIALSAEETARLLHQANRYYDTQTHQLLIAALSKALGEWLDCSDVRIDLEGHGREGMDGEALFDGMDISQTVGWFTTIYPIHFAGTKADLGHHIHKTKERLATVPHNGIGYGVLCSLAHDEDLHAARAAVDLSESEVLFNYLGQFNSDEYGGGAVSHRRQRSHALRINGMVRGGVLTFRFDYSDRQFRRSTIESVAGRFIRTVQDVIEHCAGSATQSNPARFPLARISQADVAALQAKYPNLKDLYPCTGMQQGLVLFTGREPQSGVYLTQIRMELEDIDAALLRQSWQELTNWHSILRTAFADVGQSYLLQVVMDGVALPWRELDVRDSAAPASEGQWQQEVDRLLSEERTRPFDVSTAPLMRLLLVRVTDRRYSLAWTHHHALLDGWSMGLLIKELFEIYAGLGAQTLAAAGKPSEQVEAFSYRDYIEWLQSRDHEAAARYWRSYFEGLHVAASASLPIASKRAAEASETNHNRFEQKVHTLELPAETTAQLSQLARTEGVSLSTLMLAAWGLLLSKYNAEQEILFGYATSGRPAALSGVESMVGLFINSLPIRLKITAGQTLSSWVKEIQQRQLDHEDNGFVAPADIQRHSGVSADRTLFDSLVVVENYPLDRSLLSSKSTNGPRICNIQGVEQSSFPLNLAVYLGERMTLKLAYQTKLFDDAMTLTMLQHMRQLLISFGGGGAQTISQLSLMTTEELHRAIHEWNDTATPYPADCSLPELFEAQAIARGAAPAIVSANEHWTYQFLLGRVRAISTWLEQKGVRAGDKVALSLAKEPDLIAAMLGIMRVGAAYVPIALDCPLERRSFIVADADIKWVMTRRVHHEHIDAPDATAAFLDDCPQPGASDLGLACADVDSGIQKANAQATAYVIYTSGTTGTPKGVAISHQNLSNFCAWCAKAALFKAGDRMIQFAPYTFDASAGEIFGGLLAGVELHLLADELIQEPRALARYISDQGIQFAAFPPPYLQQIDPALVPEGMTVLTAGSAPTFELIKRWGARCRYINGYGPTETTILSSAWMCEPAALGDEPVLSIGRPINNTSIYVVDHTGQLCAPGLIGEIYIGGDGVAKGYVNRSALTEQQFIPDPWKAGGRLYRTGDLGRWLPDGPIEFAGRRDRQVKVRGFRIELNEIESRMREHAAVKDAVVLVRGENDDQQLLAWVVHKNAGTQQPGEIAAFIESLAAFIKQSLPHYMLPQAIVPVGQLPLTANGKVDEKALPQPDSSAWLQHKYVAPRTSIEARLTEIWASVLKMRAAEVSVTANFFEMGGHSLLAMRAISRIREELGVDINVAELFARPVLADLALAIEGSAPNELPPIVAIDRDQPMALSFAQQRLWFIAQLDDASVAYNMAGGAILQGDLHIEALRAAFGKLVERHEVLRTCFDNANGEPVLVIQPHCDFELKLVDLEQYPESARIAALQENIDDEANAAFDLKSGPLVRGRLVKLKQHEHALLITMHHIASDGWSIGIFMNELAAIYNDLCQGRPSALPTLPVQYADYAGWQRNYLRWDVIEQQLTYWKGALHDLPAVHSLLLDKARPAQQSYRGALHQLTVSEELTQALRQLAGAHQATLFMVVNAAFSALLSRYSGETDIVLGTPIANREQAEIANVIGFFANTLLLRSDFSGDPSFVDMLRQTRERALGAYSHQQLPFDLLVDELQPQRSLSYNPLFQIMLSFVSMDSVSDLKFDGLAIHSLKETEKQTAQFDLMLDVMEGGEALTFNWIYATDLFHAQTIERMAMHFLQLLKGIVGNPQSSLSQLSMLSAAEKERLIGEFNNTRDDALIKVTWPELFATQVALKPTAIVATCGVDSLTYRQLDERSNRLANALKAKNIAAGHIVALLDHRGIDLLVMMVGVLKAGAAYLPLDPAHPSQRWLEILNEGRPALLVVGGELVLEQRWLSRKWNKERVFSLADLEEGASSSVAQTNYPGLSDLAYVIYTSGSTGKPKGVMIEHRGMINNMLSKYQPLSLTESDVIAQTASQCFDISVWQFLTAPILGAKVVIFPDAITRDAEALLAQLAAEEISIWEAVPSVIQAALSLDVPMPRMRWVLPTGEALTPSLVARWFRQYPAIPLMNAYGPAECSDDVSFEPILGATDRVFIGKPVANAKLHVVDSRLALVPVGVVGELAISGAVVGRGYLNAGELTDEVFKVNPYAQDEWDRRLYLTGDLARRMDDGRLEYIGRKDFQVKIRGFRIELGEIESRLSKHAGVSDAIVVACESGAGEKILVAYVQLDGKPGTSASVTAEQLREYLKADLPDYMIPSAIVLLDRFPLTPNGKVDRKALPAPDFSAKSSSAYVAPEGDVEQKLAKIWEEVLQIDRVSRDCDFFELGGNSLLILRVITAARKEGIELTVNDVYQNRTVQMCGGSLRAKRVSLNEWLRMKNIAWKQIALPASAKGMTLLLIDDAAASLKCEIGAIVNAQSAESMPDYVRFSSDFEKTEAEVLAKEVFPLDGGSPRIPNKIHESLKQQLTTFENQLSNADVLCSFSLSPAQKQMLAWKSRQVINQVTIRGLFSSAMLQTAFCKLVDEQDLLRSLLREEKKAWVLLAPEYDKLCFPAVDIKSLGEHEQHAFIAEATRVLATLQRHSRLPYLALWISVSDTTHHLVMVNDHLISDAASEQAVQSRLQSYLTGAEKSLGRSFRQYLDCLYGGLTKENVAQVSKVIDVKQLREVNARTKDAMTELAHSALCEMRFSVTIDGADPLVEAFRLFKSCVNEMAGLSTFSMVLNHYGRRLGRQMDFDQVGLFIDKVPFAVSEATNILELNRTIDFLSERGINFIGLSQEHLLSQDDLLPPLNQEVLFNFIGEQSKTEVTQNLSSDEQLKEKLEQFGGLLYEAFTLEGELFIRVVYRGETYDATKLGAVLGNVKFISSKNHQSPMGEMPSEKGGKQVNGRSQAASNTNVIALSPAVNSIEVNDVKKSYGKFEAVKGVSFAVKKGTCFGILGPNGAGKTSLMGMIEGITPISSGSIKVLGMDVATQIRKIQPRIGVQLQQNNYFQFLTVGQLLKFYQEFRSAGSQKRNGKTIDELLDRLSIADKKNFKVDELSGGQKQRLSIAIALLEDPDVLFLDEPTSALDPQSRRHTWEFIEQLKADKSKTIILTTHYMEEAEKLCDELLIMNGGVITSSGTPQELINQISTYHEIHVGFDREVSEPALVSKLSGIIQSSRNEDTGILVLKTSLLNETLRGIMAFSEANRLQILEFNTTRPNLEDVFLSQTGRELRE